MNVAILLSGRTDLYEYAFHDNLNNLIRPLSDAGYTVNLYGSFWDEPSTLPFLKVYEPHWKVCDIETLSEVTSGVIYHFDEYHELVKKYNPNEIDALVNVAYWLYKLDRTYKLVKRYEKVKGVIHDYYIRLRPDINLQHPLKVESLNALDDNSIIAHVDHVIKQNGVFYGYREGWIDDNFCITKKKTFDKYCSLYDNLIELSHQYKSCITHEIYQHLFEDQNIKVIQPSSPLVLHKRREDRVDDIILFLHTYPDIDLSQYGW